MQVIKRTEVYAKNEDSYDISGAALSIPVMKRSVNTKVTLEILINGEQQESILLSDKQDRAFYTKYNMDYEDFDYAQ